MRNRSLRPTDGTRGRGWPGVLCQPCILPVVAVAACFIGAASAARAAPTNGLLFHAAFDLGLRADQAAGSPEPQGMTGFLRFTPGVRGKALLSGDLCVTRLAYTNAGNFSISQGTVALWVKPIDWLGDRGKAVCFNLFVQGDGSGVSFGVEMERFNQRAPGLLCYALGFKNRDNILIAGPESARWPNGMWHHVAYTWDAQTMKLYVDGAFAGSGQITAPFTAADYRSSVFVLGHAGEEHTALDELRIWNRPLSATEITELYAGEK
jgi:hypothetical protein